MVPGPRAPALGRPATLVRVDGGRALFIGVKLTGDEIIGVLTDLCCRILLARRVPLAGRDPEAVLATVADLVRELLTEVNDKLFFIANDGKNGFELWKNDSSGTVRGWNIVPNISPSAPAM